MCTVHGTVSCLLCCFFFLKQKTAYEMRISDWSSDVCSSDLFADIASPFGVDFGQAAVGTTFNSAASLRYDNMVMYQTPNFSGFQFGEIGRASCRERVCQYV